MVWSFGTRLYMFSLVTEGKKEERKHPDKRKVRKQWLPSCGKLIALIQRCHLHARRDAWCDAGNCSIKTGIRQIGHC